MSAVDGRYQAGFGQAVFGQSYQLAGQNAYNTDFYRTAGLATDDSDFVGGLYLQANSYLGFSAQSRFDHDTLETVGSVDRSNAMDVMLSEPAVKVSWFPEPLCWVSAVLDGFATCQALKQDPAVRQIPVIFLTAKAQNVDMREGLAAGAIDDVPAGIAIGPNGWAREGGGIEPLRQLVGTRPVRVEVRIADQIGDNFFDGSRPVRLSGKLPHVAFRQEPVPQSDAADEKIAAFFIGNTFSFCPDESGVFLITGCACAGSSCDGYSQNGNSRDNLID